MSNPFQSSSYVYDSLSRAVSNTNHISVPGYPGNGSYTIAQSYDAQGRPSVTTYPHSQAFTQTYTSEGYPHQVKKGSTVLHTYAEMNAFGQLTKETYGNGLQTVRAFDADTGALTSIETGTSSLPSSVQDLFYEWRENGTLLKRTDQRGTATSSDDHVEVFTYDAINRLKTSAMAAHSRTLTNSYDDFGNLTAKTSSKTGDVDVTNYAYATSTEPHKLTSATIDGISNTFTYDANGSITRYDADSGDDLWVDYDAANRATKITRGNSSTTSSPTARDEFWYGPTGQRIVRKESWMDGSLKVGWTAYLLGGKYERADPVYDATVNFRQRIQVTDAVVNRRTHYSAGSTSTHLYYTHRDHLGSVVAMTGATGAKIRKMGFDPYGDRRQADGSADISQFQLDLILEDQYEFQGRGFTGHENLNRTGIIHMNGRIYDPELGRFLH